MKPSAFPLFIYLTSSFFFFLLERQDCTIIPDVCINKFSERNNEILSQFSMCRNLKIPRGPSCTSQHHSSSHCWPSSPPSATQPSSGSQPCLPSWLLQSHVVQWVEAPQKQIEPHSPTHYQHPSPKSLPSNTKRHHPSPQQWGLRIATISRICVLTSFTSKSFIL